MLPEEADAVFVLAIGVHATRCVAHAALSLTICTARFRHPSFSFIGAQHPFCFSSVPDYLVGTLLSIRWVLVAEEQPDCC